MEMPLNWRLPSQAEILDLTSAIDKVDAWKANGHIVVATSCPGDPIHPGHISYLQSASQLYSNSRTVVIVNDDGFLINKKGFAFIPLKARCQIISSIRGVDLVIPFVPSRRIDTTVCEAIMFLRPNVFAKGGDRKDKKSIPEWKICKCLDIKLATNCGDDKYWSSSNFLKKHEEYVISRVLKE